MNAQALETLNACLRDLLAAALHLEPDACRGYAVKRMEELAPRCTAEWMDDFESPPDAGARNMQNLCEVTLDVPGLGITSRITFAREPNDPFSAEECGMLRLIGAQALGAWHASKQLSLSRELGRSRRCAALMDRRGRVHATQGAFFQAVRASWPAWTDGLLPSVLCAPSLPGVSMHVGSHRWTVEPLGGYMIVTAQPAGAAAALTAREQAIAAAVLRSGSQQEVARQLQVSSHTVRNTLVRVYSKLGVRNRVELALRFRPELVSLPANR